MLLKVVLTCADRLLRVLGFMGIPMLVLVRVSTKDNSTAVLTNIENPAEQTAWLRALICEVEKKNA